MLPRSCRLRAASGQAARRGRHGAPALRNDRGAPPDGAALPAAVPSAVPSVVPSAVPSADWEAAGAPRPFGVTWLPEADACNFALYSKHATAVTLLLFGQDDVLTPLHQEALDPRLNKSGRVWHVRLPGALVRRAAYYAYRVDGPRAPEEGHRFDPEQLLLDPYARAIHFPPGFSRAAARRPGSNLGQAPLGLLPHLLPASDWIGDVRPRHTHDAVIYELHVRGFTRCANSGVAPERRGTYAGLIDKIPYLKELGVTIVELMPVFQYDPQEGNYWGYMPMSFFALHEGYGCRSEGGEELAEFRELVKALHAAGIEVILDVVYNHTAEADEFGPTYSFRGIDNATYYLLEADRRRYRNDSGTGNVIHAAGGYVQHMLLDSLRYWVREFRIDGFRIDLASLLTRRSDGSVDLNDPPIFSAIQADPQLAGVRLIAEAWDLASYQLGRTFPAISWMQWNGQFRDQIRRFVRGDPGHVGAAMMRLYGSDDLFPDTLAEAYRPFQSVNFVTAHDGFTLYDLVAYDRKHNAANGHGNRDGADENFSWNCGWEGDEGAPPEVLRLRERQAKNLFALLMLANGTPMFVAGDEFLRSQGGNNNPYNQDNETSWIDWDLKARNAGFFRFARFMIAFRKAHPTIARSRFWRGDVRWHGRVGDVDFGPESRAFAFCLDGRSQEDDDLYVMVNMGTADLDFVVQQGRPETWRRVVDTARPSPDDAIAESAAPRLAAPSYRVAARSLVMLLRRRDEAAG